MCFNQSLKPLLSSKLYKTNNKGHTHAGEPFVYIYLCD